MKKILFRKYFGNHYNLPCYQVPNEKSNSFDCPACGQYNGFTVDGDYNRPLDLSARGTQRYARGSPAVNGSPRENGLCRHCNLNQVCSCSFSVRIQGLKKRH